VVDCHLIFWKKNWNFTFDTSKAIVQNFMAIGWTVAEILQIIDFQYAGCLPSWIFKCSNYKFQFKFKKKFELSFRVALCITVQNLVSLKALRRYGDIFKMVAVHHIEFSKKFKFQLLAQLLVANCIIVQNFIAIGWTVADIELRECQFYS